MTESQARALIDPNWKLYASGRIITYSFPTALPGDIPAMKPEDELKFLQVFTPFSVDQEAAVRKVFDWIERATTLKFAPAAVGTISDIRFGNTVQPKSGGVNIRHFQRKNDPGQPVNDILIASNNTDTTLGGYGFETLIHEIGHALGLKHPHEPGDPVPGIVDSGINRAEATMSYANAPIDAWNSAITPLVLDLVALRLLYGANEAYHTSDDTYVLDPNVPLPGLAGLAEHQVFGNQRRVIWDQAGTDTISASDYSARVEIDLEPGSFSSTGSTRNNLSLAFGTRIENAHGGRGNDHLHGNDGVNQLEGADGDDMLQGGEGKDTLAGGLGEDTYVYDSGDGTDTIFDEGKNRIVYNGQLISGAFVQDGGSYRWVGDTNGVVTIDPAGGIKLDDFTTVVFGNQTSAETLDGHFGLMVRSSPAAPTAFDRVIVGDLQYTASGIDDLGNRLTTAVAAPGLSDSLRDSIGNDKIDGAGGTDLIDAFRGGDDYLIGGEGDDVVSGRDGDDIITGNAGADVLRGDDGKDAIYADDVASIADAMAAQAAPATGQRGDFVDGSGGEDLIVGGAGNDALNGGDQADLIIAGAGDDEIHGDLVTSSVLLFTWSVTRSVIIDANGNASYFTQYGDVGFELPTTGSDDVIYGGAGADWVRAGIGDDYADGGAGEDILFGHEDSDDLVGGSERDVLVGDGIPDVAAQGDDYLDGGTENDDLFGNGGDDQLFGGEGDDLLNADSGLTGAGEDYLDGGGGKDRLFGGARDDRLLGGAGDDQLIGDSLSRVGDGADFLDGGQGNDVLIGEGGADELRGGDNNDSIAGDYGGAGDDPNGDGDVIDGGAGDDRLFGQGGSDLIDGGGDRDLLDGGAGNDALAGGAGDDQLQGGADTDALDGGTGSDVLFGQWGNDTLAGGDGNDLLLGGLDDDTLDGGFGDDVYYYNRFEGNDSVSDSGGFDWLVFSDILLNEVSLGLGSLKINVPGGEIHLTDFDPDNPFAAGGIDAFQFADGQVLTRNQLITTLGIQLAAATPDADLLEGTFAAETFEALAGDDVVIARGGNDALYGQEGNDQLDAGAGNDYVSGGAGNDLLAGGPGSDTLEGGADDDTYVFASGDGFDTAADTLGQNHMRVTGGLTAADVRFARLGNDLTISTPGGLDCLTVKDWFTAPAFVDVRFEDGTVLDRAGVEAALPRNQAPVAADDFATVTEDGVTAVSGDVLANDVDPEGRSLRIADPDDTSTSLGSFSLAADGAYTYQLFNGAASVQALAQGEARTETFGYTVIDDDPNGAATAEGAVIVTVTGTNDLPEPGADSAATAEDAAAIGGNVLANDGDIDAGTILSVTQAGGRAGTYGTLQLDGQGAWSYELANDSTVVQQLAAGQSVQERFIFGVSDGIAEVGGALTIQVAGRNDAPVVAAVLADQVAASNSSWSWQMPAGSFSDIDEGDTLQFSATLADGSPLPAWLAFDAATQTFSGRVPKSATGSIAIQVAAADRAGAQAADVFDLLFAAGGGGGGGGGSHGNEGVGNGVDGPPPGHANGSFNDGPGTAPGSPGAQGGNGYRPPRREDLALVAMSIEAPLAPRESPTLGHGRSWQARQAAHGQEAPGQAEHAKPLQTPLAQPAGELSVDAQQDSNKLPTGQGTQAPHRWLSGEAWAEFAQSAPSGASHDAAIFVRWRAVEKAMVEGADPLALLADWGPAGEGVRVRLLTAGPAGVAPEGALAQQSGTALELFKGLGTGIAPLA